MKKIIKSLITFILIFSLTVVSACSKPNEKTIESSQVELWACPATEKILADVNKEEYSSISSEAKIDIFMAKGEFESGQIIISPSVDVPYYNVTISELSLANGEDKISVDNITVYTEKYFEVSVNYNNNNAPMGMYPDALVPVSSVVEYEQNSIPKDTNQGIYVTFETKLDQTAGLYSGEMTFDFKDFSQKVPVSVQVFDLAVSEEVRTKSVFRANLCWEHGELDSTQAMFDAYSNALVDYRLAPSTILYENDHTDDSIRRYVDKAYELLSNPRCSNVCIPYSTSVGADSTGKTHVCFNAPVLEQYLYAFAEKSFKEDFNLVEKLVFYNAIIDEAKIMGRPAGQVEVNNKLWNKTVDLVADAILADTSITSDLKEEVAESIRTIPYIFTTDYWEAFADPESDSFANVFCPMTDFCNSESAREQYNVMLEKWWYTCNKPYYPQSNYHIDFTSTVPIRAMGWEQADYGFIGTLYWSVNYYGDSVQGDRGYFQEDYFSGSANTMKLGNGALGEGRLFYPGGQYGLDYPLPSLRLEAIRDGLEEYELIYSLKEKYKELGYSADSLVKTLGSTIYIGTQVTANVNEFEQARKTLFELCTAVNSPAGMCIVDSCDNNNGAIDYKVYINDEYELKCDGVVLTNGVAEGNGKIYSVTKKLDQDSNSIKFEFDVDGSTYSYTQVLGGKITTVSAEQLVEKFKVLNSKVDFNCAVEGNAVKIDIGSTKEVTNNKGEFTGALQRFYIVHDELVNLSSSSQKVTFTLRNDNEFTIPLSVSAEYSKTQGSLVTMATIDLKPGQTVITIDVAMVSWERVGKMDRLLFQLGTTSGEDAKTVFVEKMLVYNK